MKLLLNSLFGEQIRKDFEEKFARKSEALMMTENDERVKYYWRISNGKYFVEMIDDAGLEDELKKLNTMPLHLGVLYWVIVKELWMISFMLLMDFLRMMFIIQISTLYLLKINTGIR